MAGKRPQRHPHRIAASVLTILLMGMLLAACGGRLPGTAIPESLAERHFGAVNAGTPIAAIVRERNIRPLNPASRITLLEQAVRELRKTDDAGRYAGITWSLTRGNALPSDWVVQTPALWDRRADDLPAGHSDGLPDRIYRLVSAARRTVDIAVLQPPPDGRFLDALRDAVTFLARSGRPVHVRVVVGHYPLTGVDPKTVLAGLARDLVHTPRSTVTLQVAAVRSCAGEADCESYSWNHAKIITVDRQRTLVGGHNMWSRDYLIDHPVHDLSMEVRGPAAADAVAFIDALWRFACHANGTRRDVAIASLPAGGTLPDAHCLAIPAPPRPAAAGDVSLLAVGRLASGITPDFANQSDLARDLLLGAARRSIRIVQQDLAFTLGRVDPLWPESTLERLADFLLRDRGDLHIVLSNPGAVGNSGSSYSNGVGPEAVAAKIRQVARRRSPMPDAALNALLCRRLHVATLRFGPDEDWPDGKPFGSHVKFWMVDDRLFYIGSDNLYPVDLQEFGYIVDNRAAAAELLRVWWNPLWRWSRHAAISGPDAARCVFGPGSTPVATAPARQIGPTPRDRQMRDQGA
jgi:phosphatidylserine/phosphatidylglycerophosphate/cardiolipin synthase-like enzyme